MSVGRQREKTMDPGSLAMMIPITAIVLGVGGGIVQSILKSQERRMEMRLNAQQGKNEDVTHQIDALRAEIAGLRDTSTQIDMTKPCSQKDQASTPSPRMTMTSGSSVWMTPARARPRRTPAVR